MSCGDPHEVDCREVLERVYLYLATGLHEHEGVRYFVKEPYETLVWWTALPSLLTSAREGRPDAIHAVETEIAARTRAAAEAGYRAGAPPRREDNPPRD